MRENTIAADGVYLVVQKDDEDGVWMPVQDAGRSEFIHRVPLMPLKVVVAEARLSRRNTPVIHLELSSDLTTRFAEITRRYEGSRLAFVAGGSVIIAAYINEAILDGQPCLSVSGDMLEALRKAERLRLVGNPDAPSS
ncbi:MAG: hypothetical protein HY054_03615 [Proteobacteria bacterium]|nr:hypothetical protein [Pseudomonadota bacterium]